MAGIVGGVCPTRRAGPAKWTASAAALAISTSLSCCSLGSTSRRKYSGSKAAPGLQSRNASLFRPELRL